MSSVQFGPISEAQYVNLCDTCVTQIYAHMQSDAPSQLIAYSQCCPP